MGSGLTGLWLTILDRAYSCGAGRIPVVSGLAGLWLTILDRAYSGQWLNWTVAYNTGQGVFLWSVA